MGVTVVSFVNLGRQDAFLSAADAGGEPHFVARISPGQAVRQAAMPGSKWMVVANDNYPITAGAASQVFLISGGGVYMVENAKAVPAESGAAPADIDFPSIIGGGG